MKLKQKIITVFTTTILLGGHFLPIGSLAIAVANEELEKQTSKTNIANVEFNTYLEEGAHESSYNITEGGKIYIELGVKENGYFKNGIVEFSNANYSFNGSQINSEYIQKIENNSIYLKQINNEENITIEVPVNLKKQEYFNIQDFNKESKIKLRGTYINKEGKEIAIEKEITNKLKWEADPQAQINAEITKYIPYNQEEEYGLLLQTKVNSGIKENLLPIASTALEVSVPVINGTKAENVTVIANKTVATNGEETGIKFTSQNYEYNNEENKVKINVNNGVNEQGNMAWKNGQDEYLITCIYKGKEIYDYAMQKLQEASTTKVTEEQIANGEENVNAINMPVQVNGTITTYGIEQKQIQVNSNFENNIQEVKGELADSTVQTIGSISKGYIYANYAKAEKESKKQSVEEKEKTTYELTYKAPVYGINILKDLKFITNEEKLVSEDNEYMVETNIITSKVKISEAIFQKILGNEGEVQILNKNNQEVLGIINSSSEKDEQGNYILNIEEKNVNEVIISFSNPITEGTLEVKVEKAFVENQSFSQEQMKTFTKILLTSEVQTNINNKNYNMEISLQEPVSKAEISVEEGKQTLSTVVVNKDVNINVVLDTSNIQNALYKNPVIKIQMPSDVKKVDLKDANLLLDDELKIVNKKVTNENGRQVINLTLQGTQTQYENYTDINQNNVITKGANIVIRTDITLDSLAMSKQEKIYMYYTNENTSYNQNYGISTANVEISAPTGVIAANFIKEYDKQDSQLINIDQEKLEAKIQAYSNEKLVTFEGVVTNNYNNNIKDVYILGRLPFEGNKQVDSLENLGSNFNMELENAITTSGIDSNRVKIYYSTNEDETKETLNTNDTTWQESPTNYNNIKSYLIVVSGELKTSEQIHFVYQAKLPENLSYNKNTYTSYKVYYNNQMPETKVSGIVGLQTGKGPEVELKLTSQIQENGNVKEEQIVKFYVEIKNVGEYEVKNAVVKVPVPEGTTYIKYDTGEHMYIEQNQSTISIPVGTINAKETKQIEYELKMLGGELGNIVNTVNLTADNIQNAVKSNEYILNKVEGKLVLVVSATRNPAEPLYKGDIIKALVEIRARDTLNNVTVTIDIPNGIKINSAAYYNELSEEKDYVKIENNKVIVNVDKLENGYTQSIKLNLQIENFKGDFNLFANGKSQEIEEQSSNIFTYHVSVPEFEITQDSSSAKYIKEKEDVIYEFTIKNIGENDANYVTFEDKLPNELSFKKLEYTYKNETKEIDYAIDNVPAIDWTIFEKGATAKIKITAQANILGEGKEEKEVTNIGSVSAEGYENQMSNSITTIIKRNSDLYGEDTPGGNDDQITDDKSEYKISGIAWLDENKNGQREQTEQILSGIEVILLKKENGQIVSNIQDENEVTTRTLEDGTYQFENIKAGEYIVVFCYDASKYNITDYQKQDINASYNSDAVSMLIILNGNQTYAGVTNTIKVINEDIQNIDIGLYESQKFDLKLEKYISKITLNTPTNGVKTYKLNNSKLEKVEIKSKEVNKSNIIIEYKIVVTNEGQIPGYVRKIVDYLPKNVRFNSELNNDWYNTDNGSAIYNASLQNTILKPGESKEVKLVLSAQIADNNIGTIINNNAEIYESYNEYGQKDMDSVEANMLEGEDDMSKADIILSVATGTIIIYFTLALAVLLIILIGVLVIKRKFDEIEL